MIYFAQGTKAHPEQTANQSCRRGSFVRSRATGLGGTAGLSAAMSRPSSRLGYNGGRAYGKGSYRCFPMNVNGTRLESASMPTTVMQRFDEQVPTIDTRRQSMGLRPLQVSSDVGKAQGGGFGRSQRIESVEVPEQARIAAEHGRPQCWSPAPASSDDLQRRIDEIDKRINQSMADVPYGATPGCPPAMGHSPYNRRSKFLGNPGYNDADGLPFVRMARCRLSWFSVGTAAVNAAAVDAAAIGAEVWQSTARSHQIRQTQRFRAGLTIYTDAKSCESMYFVGNPLSALASVSGL